MGELSLSALAALRAQAARQVVSDDGRAEVAASINAVLGFVEDVRERYAGQPVASRLEGAGASRGR